MRKKKIHPGWRAWAIGACAAVFVVCTGLLFRDLRSARQEEQANLRLAGQVHQVEEQVKPVPGPPSAPEAEPEPPPPRYAESGVLLQYDPLWRQNPDMAGWLRIEGTSIDYPVMYTPDSPEYYLRRAFDKSRAISGSLFLGEGWTPEGVHAIIYGHDMRNNTMFGALAGYASEDYAREHPLIRFDTLTQEREYEVLAAFYSRVYTDKDKNVFRYYQYGDLSDPERFASYVEQALAASLYQTGVEAAWGDRLLTLSTCSKKYTEDGRFVVVAREVSRETPETEGRDG